MNREILIALIKDRASLSARRSPDGIALSDGRIRIEIRDWFVIDSSNFLMCRCFLDRCHDPNMLVGAPKCILESTTTAVGVERFVEDLLGFWNECKSLLR